MSIPKDKEGALSVLHITKVLDRGGAEHHLLALCRGQVRAGLAVEMGFWAGPGELVTEFEQCGVRVHRLRIPRKMDPLNVFRFARFIRKRRPAILHTHLPLTEFFGNLGGVIAGVPVIVSSKHNDDDFLRNRSIRVFHYLMSIPNDAVIAISNRVRDHTQWAGVFDPKNLKTIYYGLDLDDFDNRARQSDPIQVKNEFCGNGEFLIGTVARLEEQKGLPYLIRAIPLVRKRFPGVKFVVIGEGRQRDSLLKLASEVGAGESLMVPGKRGDVPAFLRSLDVFVLPSLWEGFGLVLLEAMAAGRPIVATQVSAIPEVVGDSGCAFLVPPADVGALASAISQLLADPNLSRQMGVQGRKRAESQFSASVMVKKTIELYHEVLVRKGLMDGV